MDAIEQMDELVTRLAKAMVGSCDCNTKTPEVQYHNERCPYRMASESCDIAVSVLAALKAAAEQEPFAWYKRSITGDTVFWVGKEDPGAVTEAGKYKPLYTHPIASEDSERLAKGYRSGTCVSSQDGATVSLHYDSAHAAEASFNWVTSAIDAARREGK